MEEPSVSLESDLGALLRDADRFAEVEAVADDPRVDANRSEGARRQDGRPIRPFTSYLGPRMADMAAKR